MRKWPFTALVLEMVAGYQENVNPSAAAALAYYALLALAPLLTLGVAVFGFVLGGSALLLNRVQQAVSSAIPGSSTVVTQALHVVKKTSGIAGLLSVAGLALPAIGFFGSLEPVLARMFGAKTPRNWARRNLVALGASVGAVVLLLGSIAITSAITWLGVAARDTGTAAPVLPTALLVAGRTVPIVMTIMLFTGLYRVLPGRAVPIKAALWGGVIGGGTWELAKHLFAFYISRFAHFDIVYGSLGTLISVLIWAYYSGTVFLIGAQIAATITRRNYADSDEVIGGTIEDSHVAAS